MLLVSLWNCGKTLHTILKDAGFFATLDSEFIQCRRKNVQSPNIRTGFNFEDVLFEESWGVTGYNKEYGILMKNMEVIIPRNFNDILNQEGRRIQWFAKQWQNSEM